MVTTLYNVIGHCIFVFNELWREVSVRFVDIGGFVVNRCLSFLFSFCNFPFGHCVVCSSSIYGFWLPLWYLQTLLPSNDCKYIRIRRAWRYQRGNQNPYIEEEQTTQWLKEKVQKDKQRSTKHTHKTKDRVTRTPLKTVAVYTIRYLPR
jgi:hypothetical protein